MWYDAISIGLGVKLEMDGVIAEDAAWLRQENDVQHIDVAELEAVLQGVNLALKWGPVSLEIITDSATVAAWLSSSISLEARIKTRGMSEMLVYELPTNVAWSSL